MTSFLVAGTPGDKIVNKRFVAYEMGNEILVRKFFAHII